MELWRAEPGDVLHLPISCWPRTVEVTGTDYAGTEHDRLWWKTDDGSCGSIVLPKALDVDLLHTDREDKRPFLAPGTAWLEV